MEKWWLCKTFTDSNGKMVKVPHVYGKQVKKTIFMNKLWQNCKRWTRLRKSIEKCWQFYNSIEKIGKMVTVPHFYVKLWKMVTILHVNKNGSKMMKVLQAVWKMHESVWKIIKRNSSTWLWIIEKCYHLSLSLKNIDKDVAARQIYGKYGTRLKNNDSSTRL